MTDPRTDSGNERRRAKRQDAQPGILEAARRLLETREAADLTLEEVAAEAGIDLKTMTELYRNKNELVVSLAADELTGVARQMYSGNADDGEWLTASSGALGLLRTAKKVLGLAGEGEVGEAAPPVFGKRPPREFSLQENEDVMRLEDRIEAVENFLAENRNESDRSGANASVLVDESVANLNARLNAMEARQNEAVASLHKSVVELGTRLRLVEALPPSPVAVAEAHQQAQQQISVPIVTPLVTTIAAPAKAPIEPTFDLSAANEADTHDLFFDAELREAGEIADEASGETASAAEIRVRRTDMPYEGFLAAARRAANEAAAHHNSLREKDSKYALAVKRAYLSFFGKRAGDRKRLQMLGAATICFAGVATAVVLTMPPQQRPQTAAVAPKITSEIRPVNINAPEMAQLVELATAGNAKAETLIGLHYLRGEGVAHDDGKAFYWFERAAQSNQAVAQYWLANLHSRPGGAFMDSAQSVRWNLTAAKNGNRMAMNDLAVAYAQGAGVPLDMRQAANWFEQAAKHGHAVAQFNLAVLYERSDGVNQSFDEAYKWYAVAARAGDEEAAKRLEILGGSLGPAALQAAQEAAEQFAPVPLDRAANIEPTLAELRGT